MIMLFDYNETVPSVLITPMYVSYFFILVEAGHWLLV